MTTKFFQTISLVALTALFGCAGSQYRLDKEPRLSKKTVGYVSTTGADGVEVSVYHLESPQLITAGATSWVVWLAPRGGGAPKNLGALKMQPGGDEPMMTGTLRTTVPVALASYDVFITPEVNVDATQPQNARLLWTSVAKK